MFLSIDNFTESGSFELFGDYVVGEVHIAIDVSGLEKPFVFVHDGYDMDKQIGQYVDRVQVVDG